MSDTQITLLISSGDGPGECQQAVGHVLSRMAEEAEVLGLGCDVSLTAGLHGPKSALMVLHGAGGEALAKAWCGTIQWTCKSQLRSGHKRQNWFVGVYRVAAAPLDGQELDPTQVRFDSFRAGGPGGQHQNTTDSAVRATCLQTGANAVARDGRSQHRNKALALERLQALLRQQQALAQAGAAQRQNLLHHQLERGNPVRLFKGARFKEQRPRRAR